MLDPWPRLSALSRDLSDGSYLPGPARPFIIHEPKRRLITALPFRDRVVQHLLVEASLPALERWFAPQSYACRKGKGTLRALKRACELHRSFPWVLRLDIAKFFPSIDHELLLRIILPRPPRALHWLVHRILTHSGPTEPVSFRFPGDDLFAPFSRRRGLPIGDLTSQVWANAMLTPVDHLLASELGLGTFVRYSDDVLVYAKEREVLERAWLRLRARCDTLRLRLHAKKCRLHRTCEPVAFLGFVLQSDPLEQSEYREHQHRCLQVKLRRDNLRRFVRHVRAKMHAWSRGQLDLDRLIQSVRSWLAHAKYRHPRRSIDLPSFS